MESPYSESRNENKMPDTKFPDAERYSEPARKSFCFVICNFSGELGSALHQNNTTFFSFSAQNFRIKGQSECTNTYPYLPKNRLISTFSLALVHGVFLDCFRCLRFVVLRYTAVHCSILTTLRRFLTGTANYRGDHGRTAYILRFL